MLASPILADHVLSGRWHCRSGPHCKAGVGAGKILYRLAIFDGLLHAAAGQLNGNALEDHVCRAATKMSAFGSTSNFFPLTLGPNAEGLHPVARPNACRRDSARASRAREATVGRDRPTHPKVAATSGFGSGGIHVADVQSRHRIHATEVPQPHAWPIARLMLRREYCGERRNLYSRRSVCRNAAKIYSAPRQRPTVQLARHQAADPTPPSRFHDDARKSFVTSTMVTGASASKAIIPHSQANDRRTTWKNG
jgi:hypothetical protein